GLPPTPARVFPGRVRPSTWSAAYWACPGPSGRRPSPPRVSRSKVLFVFQPGLTKMDVAVDHPRQHVALAGIEHLAHLADWVPSSPGAPIATMRPSRTARAAAYVDVAVTTVPLLTRRSSGVTRASRHRHTARPLAHQASRERHATV